MRSVDGAWRCHSVGGGGAPSCANFRARCQTLLAYVVKQDGYASVAQRVRSATVLLEAAELLASESKPTNLFRAEGSDGAGEREAH
jgi:hypothetical protein